MSEPLPSPVTLEYLGRKLLQVLENQANAETNRLVDSARLERLDKTVSGLTDEVRALHGQISRVLRRLEKVEERT